MDALISKSFVDLQDKVTVITGASRGIGRATTKALVSAGSTVIAIARNRQRLQDLKYELAGLPGKCLPYACDVTSTTELEQILADVEESLGKVDILVNNAGIYMTDAVKDMSLTHWQTVVNTNLTAAFVATHAVLPAMIKQQWGRVIFISSISGKYGEAYGSAYSASKFAMIGLMQSLSLEVARCRITANAICPGWVNTDMAHDQISDEKWCNLNGLSADESLNIARFSVPQERLIEPEEIANLALYLCSDFARGITGQAINICGGLSIH
jgi:ketoreductase